MNTFLRPIQDGPQAEAGFGLVEVMVAMVIFTVGILGCYKLQLHSVESNALANRVTSSSNWATFEVEELLGKDYDHSDYTDAANGSGSLASAGLDDTGTNADGVMYVQADGSKRNTPSGADLYTVSWNIVEGTATETSVLRDVKQVRVHVERTAGIGAGRLYSHDYYKTDEF